MQKILGEQQEYHVVSEMSTHNMYKKLDESFLSLLLWETYDDTHSIFMTDININ